MDLFAGATVTNYSSNSLADVVSFKSSCGADTFLDQVVKFGCVIALLLFSYYQYLIASIRKPFQRGVYFLTHFGGDYQLAFNRYRLSHKPIMTYLVDAKHNGILKYPVSFFLPALKRLGFQTPARAI